MIGGCAERFDAGGRLTDEPARAQIGARLEAPAAWVTGLR